MSNSHPEPGAPVRGYSGGHFVVSMSRALPWAIALAVITWAFALRLLQELVLGGGFQRPPAVYAIAALLCVFGPWSCWRFSLRVHVEGDQLRITQWWGRPRSYAVADVLGFARASDQPLANRRMTFADGTCITVDGQATNVHRLDDIFERR